MSAILVGAATTHATEIVYEGFDYPATTDLNTLNGGAGWEDPWTGTSGVRQVRSPGAIYSVLETVGNKAFIQGSTSGAARLMPDALGAAEETIWISFIGQRDPAGPTDIGRFFSLTFYEGGSATANERFSIGENSSNANDLWGMHFTSGGTNRQEIAGASIYSESFLLARVDYHTAANDDIYLWANYDITQGEPAIGTAQATRVGGNNLAFDRLALRAGLASGALASAQGFFDELRIGTTFADVTPTGVAPDANFDELGEVDAADLATWAAGFGATGTATHMQGDADGDLDVDGADFLVWQRQLNAGASAELSPVPEPATAPLCLIGTVAMTLLTRRRSS